MADHIERKRKATGHNTGHNTSHTKNQGPSQAKAKKILADGTVHGKPLTGPQRRLMHARASGTPRRVG